MVQMLQMGSSSLDQDNKIGFMGYDHHDDDDSFSSDVSSVVSSDNESDDAFEEVDSSSRNYDHSTDNGSQSNDQALEDMSDLLQQLPSKRGLSKHFQGKSQSFTSLSKVLCLEDLAKPENPYNKKIKSCKSYVGLSRLLPPPTRSASSSKLFNKKTSARTSCSSLSNSSSRPPSHPSHSHSHGAPSSSGFSNQTPLFV